MRMARVLLTGEDTGELSRNHGQDHAPAFAQGLGKDQCSAEGSWRPGRVGGHDHA
ncbi:MAG: hypothetical protein ACXWLC_08865 [Rhizomicrobium sp.]